LKNLKRNAVVVVVLLFVCVAGYLNWSYNTKWGKPDGDMVLAEDTAMNAANEEYKNVLSIGAEDDAQAASNEFVSEYFAAARLTRQQSRDEALSLLQTAASTDNVSQETIDSAMSEISAMATMSMREAQMENLLIAKDFADCVVFMSDNEVTVALPAPAEGLSEAAVARVTDIITSEAGIPASNIRLIEIRQKNADSEVFTEMGGTAETRVTLEADEEIIDS